MKLQKTAKTAPGCTLTSNNERKGGSKSPFHHMEYLVPITAFFFMVSLAYLLVAKLGPIGVIVALYGMSMFMTVSAVSAIEEVKYNDLVVKVALYKEKIHSLSEQNFPGDFSYLPVNVKLTVDDLMKYSSGTNRQITVDQLTSLIKLAELNNEYVDDFEEMTKIADRKTYSGDNIIRNSQKFLANNPEFNPFGKVVVWMITE